MLMKMAIIIITIVCKSRFECQWSKWPIQNVKIISISHESMKLWFAEGDDYMKWGNLFYSRNIFSNCVQSKDKKRPSPTKSQ